MLQVTPSKRKRRLHYTRCSKKSRPEQQASPESAAGHGEEDVQEDPAAHNADMASHGSAKSDQSDSETDCSVDGEDFDEQDADLNSRKLLKFRDEL